MPIVKTGAGMHTVVMTVDDYIARSGPFLEQSGFFEHEIARRTDAFGDFAQVFSTYEGRRAEGDAEPFLRGINSLQLVHENDRWYVLQIVWQQERDAGPIPARSSASCTGLRKMHSCSKARRSGRCFHAAPLSAPTQTSGRSISVSPPLSSPDSVVSARCTSPRSSIRRSREV